MSLLFVNDRKMQEMNLQYRGIDKPTDVLSFPQQNRDALCVMRKGLKKQDLPAGLNSSLITHHSSLPLGDIVINLQQAKRQAKEHGMTFYEELTRLLIHGLLHLLGYDHERNKYHARKMRRIEKELIEAIGKRVRASAEMRIYAIKKMDR
jgi:probable rRNA maturation factor